MTDPCSAVSQPHAAAAGGPAEAPDFTLCVMDPEDPADLDAIFDMYSRLDIVRWHANPPWTVLGSRGEAREAIIERGEMERQDPLARRRAIRDAATGEVLGVVHTTRLIALDATAREQEPHRYELGWTLRPTATGRGLATRAARVLAREIFGAGLEELIIDTFADNLPSIRVAQRLGAEDGGVAEDPWYGGRNRIFCLRPEHVGPGDGHPESAPS